MFYDGSRSWILCLPALAVMVAYGAILGRAAWNQETIEQTYRTRARQAMELEQYDRAKVHYSRLVADKSEIESEDKYNWAQIVALSGDSQSATKLIEQLAPDTRAGYAPAHRFKAIQIALLLEAHGKGETGQSVDVDATLKLLNHHLSRSGEEAPQELADLWTAYHLAAGELKSAVVTLIDAARWEPSRWLQVAKLSHQIGDLATRDMALKQAAEHYAAVLQDHPRDVSARINLAIIHIDLKKWDEAEKALTDGLMLGGLMTQDAMKLKRAASDFYLTRMESIENIGENGFDEANRYLIVAIQTDPNNPLAYQRMIELYQISDDPKRRAELRSQLEQQIASGPSIPFSHFALGSALWLEGKQEEAVWHTNKALELNPELTDVANNLAWLLADQHPEQVERGLELVQMALDRKPNDPRYRDTKGMILVKLQRWDEALIEYESILSLASGERKQAIHGKLAEIYAKLGKPSLAKIHQDASLGE